MQRGWPLFGWIALGGISFSALLPFWFSQVECEGMSPAKNDVVSLSIALKAFHAEYGSYPSGDQPAIMKALSGDNVRKIRFIEIAARRLSSKGRYCDPWGNPYRIDTSRVGHLRVHSPGENGREELDDPRADDIRSWM